VTKLHKRHKLIVVRVAPTHQGGTSGGTSVGTNYAASSLSARCSATSVTKSNGTSVEPTAGPSAGAKAALSIVVIVCIMMKYYGLDYGTLNCRYRMTSSRLCVCKYHSHINHTFS
jgi:hypothetical protein